MVRYGIQIVKPPGSVLFLSSRLVRLIHISIAVGSSHVDSVVAHGVLYAVDYAIEFVDVAYEAMVLEYVSLGILDPFLYSFAYLFDQF